MRLILILVSSVIVPTAHGMRTSDMEPVPIEDRRPEALNMLDTVYEMRRILINAGRAAKAGQSEFKCRELADKKDIFIRLGNVLSKMKTTYSITSLVNSPDEFAQYKKDSAASVDDAMDLVALLRIQLPNVSGNYADTGKLQTCAEVAEDLYVTARRYLTYVSASLNYVKTNTSPRGKARLPEDMLPVALKAAPDVGR